MTAIPENAHYPNKDDWKSDFWKHRYLITVTQLGIPFAVNADCEGDALDYILDYIEERPKELGGLLHHRYLSTFNVHIEEI